MKVVLGGVTLPVSGLGVVSPQRVTWIEVPAGKDVAQDWGPGPESFSLSGTWLAKETPVERREEVEELKRRREPVALRLGPNAWQVVVGDCRYQFLPGGGMSFEIECRVAERPAELVHEPRPEVRGVDVSAQYIALLRLKAAAFWALGVPEYLNSIVADAESRILEIRDWLGQAVSLVDLPGDTLGAIRRAAETVASGMETLIEDAAELLETGRPLDSEEDSLREALRYAREVHLRMRLLVAGCNEVPRREQKRTVGQGETMATIAADWNRSYGTRLTWADIARANGLADPGDIVVGQELEMPA